MKKLIKKHQAGNKISNNLTDTGTRLLHAVSSLGGSAIGDAIEGLSPKVADIVEKYSFGMVPHTSQEQLEANRTGNPDRWGNRVAQTAGAITNVGAAELTGGAMKWGGENIGRLVPKKFEPNPNAYYRMMGKEGFADAAESGVIRPKQQGTFAGRKTYYSKGAPNDKRNPVVGGGARKGTYYEGPYMAEVLPGEKFPQEATNLPQWKFGVTNEGAHIPISEPNVKLYKENWLRGYKEVKPIQSNQDMEILNFWGKKNKSTPTAEPKVGTQIKEPAFSSTDRTKFSEKEAAFIKDRDAMYGTNYSDVLAAKTSGKKFNIIPEVDGSGYAYHGRNIDMDMFGQTHRMRMGHTPNVEYIKSPSKYNLDLGGITVEAEPRKLAHEVSHGNDLASDLFKKHNLASKIDEKGIKEWKTIDKEADPEIRKGLSANYAAYSKAKAKLLLDPAKSTNSFNKSLLVNKVTPEEYYINSAKELYPNNLGNRNISLDSEKLRGMTDKDYYYLSEPSEVKARLHDIKANMVKQGVLEDETSKVTWDHIKRYEPIDDSHKGLMGLYKNKPDLLRDLSKVGVLGTLPAVAGLKNK